MPPHPAGGHHAPVSSHSLLAIGALLGLVGLVLVATGLAMQRHERVLARRRQRRHRRAVARPAHLDHPDRVTHAVSEAPMMPGVRRARPAPAGER